MIADTEGKTTTLATSWSTSLTQTFSNVSLQPVSSVDGKKFFKMASGATNGLGVADSTATFSSATAIEHGSTSTTATDAYVLDYVFQLKATNSNSSDQSVAITTLNLNAPIADNGSGNAFRVAVLSETYSTAFTSTTPTSAASIYAPSGAEYNTTGKAISSVDNNGSATYGDVTIAKTANTIGTVTSSSTAYFKVWVRLWLEGEDKSCYNDLFLSSGDWSLNLEVKMGDSITGVSALGVNYTSSIYLILFTIIFCVLHTIMYDIFVYM